MKFIIYLISPLDDNGKATVLPEIVETFEGNKQQLENRLLELQSGYCQNEKPKIVRWNGSKAGTIFIEAVSDSDYSYLTKIKRGLNNG